MVFVVYVRAFIGHFALDQQVTQIMFSEEPLEKLSECKLELKFLSTVRDEKPGYMAGTSYTLYFPRIVQFRFIIIAFVFLAELVHFL